MKKIPSLQKLIIFLLVIGLMVLILLFPEKIKELGKYGYLGAFLISLLSNATIVIPAPGWAVISALAIIFNPWLIGVLAGLGAAIGQLTGYFLGYSGQLMIKDTSRYQKLISWMQRRGPLVIFLFTLIPNPFVDIVGVGAGVLKFPFLKFLFFCTIAAIPKYLFFAIVGGWGLEFFLSPSR